MGSVTARFQSETPLHPAASAFLLDAFDRGWADPSKITGESRKAAILQNEAKEVFGSHLGLRVDQVEFLADPEIGFHLGISGLLNPESTLYFSAVERTEVYAIAQRVVSEKLAVGIGGVCDYPEAVSRDVLAWQSANGETGIVNPKPTDFSGHIFVDATATGSLLELPGNWSTALWNSRAWQGPAGLGVFAVAERSIWRNPLPHNDGAISTHNFSPPLAMASAIAVEAFHREYQERQFAMTAMSAKIREFLGTEISAVDVAGTLDSTLPHLLSFSFLYVDAQMLVSELDRRGFAIDSGSACNSSNMEPSHVLAAMGLLTHGNVRVTLQPQTTEAEVDLLLHTLKEIVLELRG